MTATKDFFIQNIAETVSKSIGLPIVELQFEGENRIKIVISIEGSGADTFFWKAILELMKESVDD